MNGVPTAAETQPSDLQHFAPDHPRRGRVHTCLHKLVARGRSRASLVSPVLDILVQAIASLLELPWQGNTRSFPGRPLPCHPRPELCRSCCKESNPAVAPETCSHARFLHGRLDT